MTVPHVRPLIVAGRESGGQTIAGVSVGRFAINSTVGIVGLFDVATQMGWVSRPEDLGATLCTYRLPPGPYFVVPVLGAFYYSGASAPAVVARPPLGAPSYELRFRNGYATGIVAGARLDRFLSYGVNLGRFAKGRWYGVPERVAAEVRRLAKPLAPLPLTRSSLARSH